ncbi:unnamed protein product, partial [Coregonus sp. 'balchen']
IIEYATAYKTVLTTIKKEFDELICAINKSDHDAKLAHGKLKAVVAQPTSLIEKLCSFRKCKRVTSIFYHRHNVAPEIAIIQRDTAELQAELKSTGVEEQQETLVASEDLGEQDTMARWANSRHRDNLQIKRKSLYVSVSVKADLDNKMRSALDQSDELAVENERLQLRAVVFEDDDPSKVNESELLVDYIESSHSVQGELPPLLLFFQALMISVHAGKHLPWETLGGPVCHTAQLCRAGHTLGHPEETNIQQGSGGCEHRDRKPRMANTCLALADIVYKACGVLRKATLSMCKRGMTSNAMEFIYRSKGFTADYCLFGCPSLALLQALTQEYQGQPGVISLGFACHALLNSDLEVLALQMVGKICRLHALISRASTYGRTHGQVELTCAAVIFRYFGEDSGSLWPEERALLAQEILFILLSQSGTMYLSPGIESSRLMAHVFM